MLIVDAHQDLAWNIQNFGRNYTYSAAYTRQQESGTNIPLLNDDTLLGWPEYNRGEIAVIFATLFATPMRFCTGPRDKLCYLDENQARIFYQSQIETYTNLFEKNPDKFQCIRTRSDLEQIIKTWQSTSQNDKTPNGRTVGLLILMEGADAVRDPSELESWWLRGVRMIGPAWASTRYCGGTREPGKLTKAGFTLLEFMAELHFGLDISHMDEVAALQALEVYPGLVVASHSNAGALLKDNASNRHLSDRTIQEIIMRDGMVGIVPFNAFLTSGWRRGDRREEANIFLVIDQIDYICQIAGDALHVGLGTDFDGGFGLQSVPPEFETIADLQKLVPLLEARGYTTNETTNVMGGNWIKRLERLLAESS